MADNDGTPARASPPKKSSRFVRSTQWFLLHLVTIAIYMIPIFTDTSATIMKQHHDEDEHEEAVLDELHIVSNPDINSYDRTWSTIFANDYWGRPLTYHSSHKSWRPLSVLSFRYLRGIPNVVSDLGMHRLVNVLTHAAAAELVGILAVKLLLPGTAATNIPPQHRDELQQYAVDLLRGTAKLCFALHPTHVEVVANAANRPHILAVLLTVYASDPATPWFGFAAAIVAALLSCETALFQMVPVAVTLVAVAHVQRCLGPTSAAGGRRHGSFVSVILGQVVTTALQPAIFLRLWWLATATVVYYVGRWHYDTLSIPVDLIRPAENPFFDLTGWQRWYSYTMVLGIHVAKQWDADYVGFAHEYGHACIERVSHGRDVRLWPAIGIAVAHAAVAVVLWRRQRRRQTLLGGWIVYAVYLSWTLTLFPISGIVKVGTFIADRIVVASTVPIAIVQAYCITYWIQLGEKGGSGRTVASVARKQYVRRKWYLLAMVAMLAWKRIYQRSREWMSSGTLLESSLRTCPRFAKGHVEISKLYSGLDVRKYNTTRAKWHLQQAESIDPNFCDVHQQFAIVAVKQHDYPELEKRLLQSLQCPFTMSGAIPMWKQYWQIQLDERQYPAAVIQENGQRYETYKAILEAAAKAGAAKEKEKKEPRKSPFAIHWNKWRES